MLPGHSEGRYAANGVSHTPAPTWFPSITTKSDQAA